MASLRARVVALESDLRRERRERANTEESISAAYNGLIRELMEEVTNLRGVLQTQPAQAVQPAQAAEPAKPAPLPPPPPPPPPDLDQDTDMEEDQGGRRASKARTRAAKGLAGRIGSLTMD